MRTANTPRRLVVVLIALLSTGLPSTAAMAARLAVLEFEGDDTLDTKALAYLSDEVRAAALRVLDRSVWEVITRENMIVMLEANTSDLAECIGECEVETGQLLGADLVVSGSQLKLGSQYRVQLKAFDTQTGNLLAIEKVEADDVDGLVDALGRTAEALYIQAVPGAATATSRPTEGGDQVIDGGSGDWTMNVVPKHVVGFVTDPAGASVSVDGSFACMTPCSKALTEGRHSIALVLTRYDPANRIVDVYAPTTIEEPLVPQFGWLTVHTDPADLPLLLDGEPVGQAPLSRVELAPGAHMVVLDSPQWLPDGRSVQVVKAEEKVVEIAGRMRIGGLQVSAKDPRGNDLSLPVAFDGQEVGLTPWSGTLQVGGYSVTVGSWSGEVIVEEEVVEELVATIEETMDRPRTANLETDQRRAAVNTARTDDSTVVAVEQLRVEFTTNSDPAQIVLTHDDRAELTFSAEGGLAASRRVRKTPLDGLALRVDVNVGSLASVRPAGHGKYVCIFHPPDGEIAPRFALFSIVDVRFPETATGFYALPLVGHIPWQVATGMANVQVVMEVAGQQFGPFLSDSAGRATVPILVPPGVPIARATVVMPDGTSTSPQTVDLMTPTFSLVKVAPPADVFPTGANTPIYINVIAQDGSPADRANLEVSADLGTLSSVTPIGNGIYRAVYFAPTVSAPMNERITAELPGYPNSVDTVEFQIVPGR